MVVGCRATRSQDAVGCNGFRVVGPRAVCFKLGRVSAEEEVSYYKS